jgi:UDP-2-acetamido-3-amino-2,3-dideoxy-glucuronate N-acetyltransferase
MTPRLLKLRSYMDARGALTVADREEDLPFSAVRYFLVRDVPAGATRAEHAQRVGHEVLSCVAGGCTVDLWWPGGEATHRLADPATALYVPPLVWVRCRDFSADAALLVLCSHPYDPLDQITDFEEFAAGVLADRPAAPRP